MTYELTVCTPGSAPGPAHGNEYGRTLPLVNELSNINLNVKKERLEGPKFEAQDEEDVGFWGWSS